MKIEPMLVHRPSGVQVSIETIERIHAMAVAAVGIPESLLTPRRPLTTAEEIHLAQREAILKEMRQYQAERGIKPV